MTELIIKLRKDLAVVTGTMDVTTVDSGGIETVTTVDVVDWLPALKAAATEVQALNAYSGTETFPTPIPCDPEATQVENILGTNTPPDATGHVTVRVPNYNSLETSLFPMMPTTFTFTFGLPEGVGRFI